MSLGGDNGSRGGGGGVMPESRDRARIFVATGGHRNTDDWNTESRLIYECLAEHVLRGLEHTGNVTQ